MKKQKKKKKFEKRYSKYKKTNQVCQLSFGLKTLWNTGLK